MKKFDVIVLGAGIVGVCTSLYLQLQGRNVCLIDKKAPGEGTSYGNAGLIERSSVIPYSCPRDFRSLLSYAINRQVDVRFDWTYLPKIMPWLFRFWLNSAPKRLEKTTRDLLPLVENSVKEHDFLAEKANAFSFIESKGWLEVYHTEKEFEIAKRRLNSLDSFHLNYDILDKNSLLDRIPSLNNVLAGGIHWLDPKTVNDPLGLTTAYANYFLAQGGSFLKLDALKTVTEVDGWSIQDNGEHICAKDIVVALGAQSPHFLKKFGYKHIPFAIKRGYHLHYEQKDADRVLTHPVCDPHSGFVIAPMRQGIRLTTGIEFAAENAPAYWTQILRAESVAKKIFPLGNRIEVVPWLGQRPCLADMKPIIGAAPNHQGLWFNFGHAHHGLTLGAVSGKLLSEIMANQKPLTSVDAFSLTRF